jgi:hypothetical protein
MDGQRGWLLLGGAGADGPAAIRDSTEQEIIVLNAANADIAVGGGGKQGTLRLRDGNGADTLYLSAATGEVAVGGGGKEGRLRLQNAAGVDKIQLGFNGNIAIKNDNGNDGIVMGPIRECFDSRHPGYGRPCGTK